MTRGFLAALLAALSARTITAQSSSANECSCARAIEQLDAKIQADYVGHALDPAAREEYRLARERLGVPDAPASSQECVRRLQALVAVFHDGHLFVSEFPRPSASELQRFEATAPSLPLDEASVRASLAANSRPHDPIEGIWYARDGSRFGIVPDPEEDHAYVAVTLHTPAARWRTGQIKARLRRLGDGSYDATLFGDDHVPRHPAVYCRGQEGGAAIRAGVLLHMPPTTWGRELPVASDADPLLDPEDPRAPTFRMLDAGTAIFYVPSHSPEYAGRLHELVDENLDLIREAENLIIDIRGDEGGSSGTTDVLEPFYRSTGRPDAPAPEVSVVLSSPDNIAYFRAMLGQGWIPRGLIARMEASPGHVVPFLDAPEGTPEKAREPVAAEETTALPKHVAILMDRGVVSAGEAFVSSVRKSAKVTLFGENTGGVLDYQNVTMVPFGDECAGLFLGYPTLASSGTLPRGGINGVGIPPDIALSPGTSDGYGAIVRHLEKAPPR